jgi:hypothetical protein
MRKDSGMNMNFEYPVSSIECPESSIEYPR